MSSWRDGLDAARSDARAVRQGFAEHVAVTTAENTVTDARIKDLHEQATKAHRRIPAAKGRLTRAQRDGNAERIAAAAAHLRAVQQEADRIGEANIAEMSTLIRGGLDRLHTTIELMGEVFDADARITDQYRQP